MKNLFVFIGASDSNISVNIIAKDIQEAKSKLLKFNPLDFYCNTKLSELITVAFNSNLDCVNDNEISHQYFRSND